MQSYRKVETNLHSQKSNAFWKVFVSAILLVVLCFMGTVGLCATNYLNPSKAKVYSSPTTSAKSVSLPAGTIVEKVAVSGNWMKVKKDGNIGYMKTSQLTKVKDFDDGAKAYLTEKAPLYKAYGSSRKHCNIPADTEVLVFAATEDWAYVAYRDYEGFVACKSLTTEKPKTEDKDDSGFVTGRRTGYVAVEKAKVYKSYSTSSKVLCTLTLNTKITVTAVKGDWCRVENDDGDTAYMRLKDLSTKKIEVEEEEEEAETPSHENNEDAADTAPEISDDIPEGATPGDSTATPASGSAVEMDWWTSGIQDIFSRGTVVTVTDVATGIAWKEKRTGGTNHADCQPLTAADTAAMLAACGEWSWARRAVIITINGKNYAASMNCMPHSSDSIEGNNFDGHHCIHFTNSRTHTSNVVCELHQKAIKIAASASL